MKKFLLTLMGIGLFCSNANASASYSHSKHGGEYSATGRACAYIIEASSAKVDHELDLGMMHAKNKGYVVIDENNQRYAEGLGLATSKPHAGVINLRGPRGMMVSVNVPEVKFHGSIGKIAEFKPTVSHGGKAIALSPNDGKAEIRVGGKLELDGVPESGTHKGFYVVQMSY